VPATLTRRQVLDLRVHVQQLDRASGDLADTAVLDLGVQDTGTDGGRWALALRGVSAPADDDLATVWTIRGAPHLYRRADLPGVAAATAPFSDADAGKRIFDAAKPLEAAGISNLEGLDVVAATMRSVVTAPMVKGEMSGRLTELLPEPYLRFCRPCDATHVHEMPFRLAALRAGLELEPGTSPPVLRPVPGLAPVDTVPERLDVVRGYLRLLGPATPRLVAGYLDAPVRDVQARWPEDAVEVSVDGEQRWLLAEDAARLGDVPPATGVLLLGPLRPVPAGPRPAAAGRGPGPGQGAVAGARPARRGARRRGGRRHLAAAQGRRVAHRGGRAVGAGPAGGGHRRAAERLAASAGYRSRTSTSTEERP
jgi:hypothetical protein